MDNTNVDARIEQTIEVVTAYLSNNQMDRNAIPELISSTFSAVNGLGLTQIEIPIVEEPAKREPAVPIKKSIQPDYIVDLFTGARHKILKRVLMSRHNMTPEQYREYWGLPHDYPMVAPGYANKRSALAKRSGLGKKKE